MPWSMLRRGDGVGPACLPVVVAAWLAGMLPAQERVQVALWLSGPRVTMQDRDLVALRAASTTTRAAIALRLRAAATATAGKLAPGLRQLDAELQAVLAATPVALVRVDRDRLDALAALPDVARLELAVPMRAALEAATAASHHDADAVHLQLAQRGAGTTIGIVDTGVELVQLPSQLPHPAFLDQSGQSRIVRSWSAYGTSLIDLTDRHGHGTNVAAIAAGRRWNALPQVDDGFAPSASIASYRVTPDATDVTTTATLAQAYDQILLDRLGGLPVTVVNCSFKGSPDPLAVDQVALDRLAHLGDVVVVVSGGNAEAGDPEPKPTVQSPSACNGIAVGSIDKNTRALSPFSAVGPLPSDGERTYPDLMAVGQDVHTARRVDSTTFDTVSGTSFSAPMVAGSAALIRAARPDLDALTVKALLLQNTADLSLANPGRDRNHVGVGMLRTDLAVTAALTVQPLFRGTLAPLGVQTFSVSLAAGARMALAAAWWRTDTVSATWPDLDVTVRDPNGQVVGTGASRRNLYERFVFAAPTAGIYSVELRSVAGASADAVMLVAPDLSLGRANGQVTSFSPGCAGSGPRIDAHLVLPTPTFGNALTNKPLAEQPCTLLVAYDRASVPSARTVRALAFRRAQHEAATTAFSVSLRVTMGYTRNHPDALATTPPLAANFDPAAPSTLVFAGTVAMPATSAPASATAFDFVVPLTTPFSLDPALGHPLLMFEVLGNSAGNAALPVRFDAVGLPASATGRVLQYAGNGTVLPANVRLVTAFVSDGLPGAVPRTAWSGEPLVGAGFQVALRDAAPGSVAVLVQGLSAMAWGGVMLPLSLSPIGAPGCNLAVSVDAALVVPVDAAGMAVVGFAVPLSPSLVGAQVLHQFAVVDPAANAAGLVVSDATRALLGG